MEAAARLTLDPTGQPTMLPDEVAYRQHKAGLHKEAMLDVRPSVCPPPWSRGSSCGC